MFSATTSSAVPVISCLISFGSSSMPSWRPKDLIKPDGAGGLAGGRRARHGRHHDVGVTAVLRRARVAEPRPDRGVRAERHAVVVEEVDELLRRVHPQPVDVGDGALHLHRLVVERRDVVVGRVQVRRDDREEHALAVGVLERLAREARVEQRRRTLPRRPRCRCRPRTGRPARSCWCRPRTCPTRASGRSGTRGRRRCRPQPRWSPGPPPRRGRSRGCWRSSSWRRRRGRCRRRRSPSPRCRRRSRCRRRPTSR